MRAIIYCSFKDLQEVRDAFPTRQVWPYPAQQEGTITAVRAYPMGAIKIDIHSKTIISKTRLALRRKPRP